MVKVWFPSATMTLVRRSSAEQPHNNFVFRVDPSMTKTDIREYLRKVYNVNPVRIGTVNHLGKLKRTRRNTFYKESDYKTVYVRLSDKPVPAAPKAPVPSFMWKKIKAAENARAVVDAEAAASGNVNITKSA